MPLREPLVLCVLQATSATATPLEPGLPSQQQTACTAPVAAASMEYYNQNTGGGFCGGAGDPRISLALPHNVYSQALAASPHTLTPALPPGATMMLANPLPSPLTQATHPHMAVTQPGGDQQQQQQQQQQPVSTVGITKPQDTNVNMQPTTVTVEGVGSSFVTPQNPQPVVAKTEPDQPSCASAPGEEPGTSGSQVPPPLGGSTVTKVKVKKRSGSSGIKGSKNVIPPVSSLTGDHLETFHAYKEICDSHVRLNSTTACQICDKQFAHWGGLQRHLQSHANFRPYVCKLCGKTFHCQSKMRRHEGTHTGLKPHKCPLCDVRVSRREHLKRHLLTHSETKPFTCSACGYSGKRLDSIKAHIKSKHEEGTAGVVMAGCPIDLADSPGGSSDRSMTFDLSTSQDGESGGGAGSRPELGTGMPVFPGFVETNPTDDSDSDCDSDHTDCSSRATTPERSREPCGTPHSAGAKGKRKRKPSHPMHIKGNKANEPAELSTESGQFAGSPVQPNPQPHSGLVLPIPLAGAPVLEPGQLEHTLALQHLPPSASSSSSSATTATRPPPHLQPPVPSASNVHGAMSGDEATPPATLSSPSMFSPSSLLSPSAQCSPYFSAVPVTAPTPAVCSLPGLARLRAFSDSLILGNRFKS